MACMEAAGFVRIPTVDPRWVLVMHAFSKHVPTTLQNPTFYQHDTMTSVQLLKGSLDAYRTGYTQPIQPPVNVPNGAEAAAAYVKGPLCSVKRCSQPILNRNQEQLWKQHQDLDLDIEHCPEHWLQRIRSCHQCDRIHVPGHETGVWKLRRLGATIRYDYACDTHLDAARACPKSTESQRCAKTDAVEQNGTYLPACPRHDASRKRPHPSPETSPPSKRARSESPLLPSDGNRTESGDEDYLDQDVSEPPPPEEEDDSGISQDYRGNDQYSSDDEEEPSATETDSSE